MSRVRSNLTVATRAAGACLSLAAGVGSVRVAAGPAHAITYPGRSASTATLTLVVGVGLVVAALTQLVRRAHRSSDLLLLASITWYSPVWVGWTDGSAVVRSVAALLPGLTLPLLLHATMAHPLGRVGSLWVRVLIGVAYAEAFGTAGLLAVFRDPYFDPSCWANCSVNSFLISSHPSLVHDVELADRWSVAVIAAGLSLACVIELLVASPAARGRLAPTRVPAAIFTATVVAHAVARQRTTVEDPFDAPLAAVFQVSCWSIVALAAGFVWASARSAAERRAVSRIAASLDEAPAPGRVRAALAAALHDPDLRIAYWLPRERTFVDADGTPATEPLAMADRVLTRLTHEGQTVAVVDHLAAAAGQLEEMVGPSLRLGLANERLQAEVLAELAALRASRARIVAAGDAERRHLERNLHDGAQQHLLALSYDLRLARAAAESDADAEAAGALAAALARTQVAIDDLRELARGIYPAVLAEAGLLPALESLALTAPLPIEVDATTDGRRYPEAVETAAYVAISEAVDSAARRGASCARVRVADTGADVVVTVQDDADPDGTELVSVADRVGALGGTIVQTGGECRAVIPCG